MGKKQSKQQVQQKQQFSVLLAGSEFAGKSTLLKRLKQQYQPYTVEELQVYSSFFWDNIGRIIQHVVEFAKQEDADYFATMNTLVAKIENAQYQYEKVLPEMRTIMRHERTRTLAEQVDAKNGTNISSQYIWDNVERILAENYAPTLDDVYNVRVKTAGIVEVNLTMEPNMLVRWVDAGGRKYNYDVVDKHLPMFNVFPCILYLVDCANNSDTELEANVARFAAKLKDYKKVYAQSRIVIVANKMDLPRFGKKHNMLIELLQKHECSFEVLSCSALTGEYVDQIDKLVQNTMNEWRQLIQS